MNDNRLDEQTSHGMKAIGIPKGTVRAPISHSRELVG